MDFQVIGVEGCLVPSPRTFLAGGPLASLQLRFLFLMGTCMASDLCSGSGVGATSAGGITTGTTEATTASQHWHTVCNSERRSWKEHKLSGVNSFTDCVSLLNHIY